MRSTPPCSATGPNYDYDDLWAIAANASLTPEALVDAAREHLPSA